MNISEEERRRRSERARELHAKGVFGGPQPGSGRPKKRRASELVAEQAAVEAESIIDAFRRGVKAPDPKVAVMAAKTWLDVEQKNEELAIKERKQLEDMSRDDLIKQLAEGFARLKGVGVDFVDSSAEEVPVAELADGS